MSIGVNTIPDRAGAVRYSHSARSDGRADQGGACGSRQSASRVSWRILDCPGDPRERGGGYRTDVVVNPRVGSSDARFYRHTGVPSVVYGVAPKGMGVADEYVTVEDMKAEFAMHALAGFDYLRGGWVCVGSGMRWRIHDGHLTPLTLYFHRLAFARFDHLADGRSGSGEHEYIRAAKASVPLAPLQAATTGGCRLALRFEMAGPKFDLPVSPCHLLATVTCR